MDKGSINQRLEHIIELVGVLEKVTKTALAEKDREIERLNRFLASKEEALDVNETTIISQGNELAALRAKLEGAEKIISWLERDEDHLQYVLSDLIIAQENLGEALKEADHDT